MPPIRFHLGALFTRSRASSCPSSENRVSENLASCVTSGGLYFQRDCSAENSKGTPRVEFIAQERSELARHVLAILRRQRGHRCHRDHSTAEIGFSHFFRVQCDRRLWKETTSPRVLRTVSNRFGPAVITRIPAVPGVLAPTAAEQGAPKREASQRAGAGALPGLSENSSLGPWALVRRCGFRQRDLALAAIATAPAFGADVIGAGVLGAPDADLGGRIAADTAGERAWFGQCCSS